MKPKRVRGHAIDRPKSYPRNELVVLLGVNAGLRHAEAAGLQGEFMILEKKLVVVPRQSTWYGQGPTKGQNGRFLEMPRHLILRLREWIAMLPPRGTLDLPGGS